VDKTKIYIVIATVFLMNGWIVFECLLDVWRNSRRSRLNRGSPPVVVAPLSPDEQAGREANFPVPRLTAVAQTADKRR